MTNQSEEILTEKMPALRCEFEELLLDALTDLRPLHRVQGKARSREPGREGAGRQLAELAAAS